MKSDAQTIVGCMNLKTSKGTEFYCKFQVDVEGRLANMFWRDGCLLVEYNNFSDVLIFDSTYKINLYNKRSAVFMGTNHYMITIVFGCAAYALLVDEIVDTYT